MGKIRGWFVCNGAEYAFLSLKGEMKWVFRELLKHMKKWGVEVARIDVDDMWKYTVHIKDKVILIYRLSDGKSCVYRMEG